MNESIENNNHECISLLLNNSDTDLFIADQAGETALHILARCADLRTLHIFQGVDHLEDLDPDARNNAGLTATELFTQRVTVAGADIEMAFGQLMGMMYPKGGSGLKFFDAVENISLPIGKAMDGVKVTVKEILVQ